MRCVDPPILVEKQPAAGAAGEEIDIAIVVDIDEGGGGEGLHPERERGVLDEDRLLRRALDSPQGLVMTAHLPGNGDRIGFCVTGPLVDPLVGDAMPMVVALYVDPNFRHRGLARKMVLGVRMELAERGHGTLAARAGHNDDALISMGERWGFVRAFEVMVREEGG